MMMNAHIFCVNIMVDNSLLLSGEPLLGEKHRQAGTEGSEAPVGPVL